MRTLPSGPETRARLQKTSAASQGMASDAVSNFGFGWRSAFSAAIKPSKPWGFSPEVHLFAPAAIFPGGRWHPPIVVLLSLPLSHHGRMFRLDLIHHADLTGLRI